MILKFIKETGRLITGLMLCLAMAGTKAYASEGEEFITISVEAQDNSSGQMMYALDTDDPSAFTTSNTFTVPAGTPHTIYVKDAAGNITSQSFDGEPAGEAATPGVNDSVMENRGTEDQQIDINLELEPGQGSAGAEKGPYDYMTDIPAEKGNGTLQSKVKTDGSSDASRLFYTITTDEGEVFYMVIDQNQTADNVYLLEQVKTADLQALASDGEAVEKEESLLDALAAEEETEAPKTENAEPESEKNINGNIIILVILFIAGGGCYYYMKIYKAKKEQEIDALDAMDMEDFAAEEDEKEEVEFDIDDEEQDEYIQHLIDKEEEGLLDADPEDYYPAEQEETAYGEDPGEQEAETPYEDDTMYELDVEEENEE